ncbi:hypothetical protein [Prevotellamassilia timonensis]|uniref:hypothetical protein n=1 Tax=Prevotellamassilia timonensis TaxID=1852370 RepID=UPI0030771A62
MTEEEKKEFEEFLLWKKERKKQKEETPFNASNTDSEEEKGYDRNIHNEKKKKYLVANCIILHVNIFVHRHCFEN